MVFFLDTAYIAATAIAYTHTSTAATQLLQPVVVFLLTV